MNTTVKSTKKIETLIKERKKYLEEFNKYENMKSKNLNSESIASSLRARKTHKDIKLLKMICLYFDNKNAGIKTNIRNFIEILAIKQHPYDIEVKISVSTFWCEVNYYKKHKCLKPYGNKGRMPTNKISDIEREVLIDEFDKMLDIIKIS